MNSLSEQIRSEIAHQERISFARFMELVLYCPVYGYYEKKEDRLGRRGDYFTSVSVGPLFGQLLAYQFADWLEGSGGVDCNLVEAGAHDGRLAGDILSCLQTTRPALFERIKYDIIEPSNTRREWQNETLSEFAPRVRWFSDLRALREAHPQGIQGVFFSNELLDAFPVHRLGWDSAQRVWFEWGVACQGSEFVWTRLASSPVIANSRSILEIPAALLDVLPEGFTTEICPAAETWWSEAARALGRGRLLTLDYGLESEEYFTPGREQGTLRAYQGHRVSQDVLANPGNQDITAHVNFTVIRAAGEKAGLITETSTNQGRFLSRIALTSLAGAMDAWTSAQRRQFQTLIHPEHLGRAFHVLVQSRV